MAVTKTKNIESNVWEALQTVKDPEIPRLSVVELGMITNVEISGEGVLTVTMTPTFAACPAIEYIKKSIANKIEEVCEDISGITSTNVKVNYDIQWTSDRITEEGRKKLKEFGLSPPPDKKQENIDEETFKNVQCPHCDSTNTELRTPFGSTLCRAIHYCKDCKQTFEQFKPV